MPQRAGCPEARIVLWIVAMAKSKTPGAPQRVGEWMTADPIVIEPDSSALEALDTMVESAIRHLPVVDSKRRVIGILTLDDLRAALPVEVSLRAPLDARQRELARDYAVREVMTFEPVCTREDAPLGDAAARLAELRIGCLPVLDPKGRLVGILSETDALTALVGLLRDPEHPTRARDRARVDLLVARLRAERDRLAARVTGHERTRRELATERHELPTDLPEQARELTDLELEGSLADWAEQRLRSIERALELAARGKLGFCERCGGAIPVARMRALPGTTLCVACARG
jgi:acetoin utilization protein AcuB